MALGWSPAQAAEKGLLLWMEGHLLMRMSSCWAALKSAPDYLFKALFVHTWQHLKLFVSVRFNVMFLQVILQGQVLHWAPSARGTLLP